MHIDPGNWHEPQRFNRLSTEHGQSKGPWSAIHQSDWRICGMQTTVNLVTGCSVFTASTRLVKFVRFHVGGFSVVSIMDFEYQGADRESNKLWHLDWLNCIARFILKTTTIVVKPIIVGKCHNRKYNTWRLPIVGLISPMQSPMQSPKVMQPLGVHLSTLSRVPLKECRPH